MSGRSTEAPGRVDATDESGDERGSAFALATTVAFGAALGFAGLNDPLDPVRETSLVPAVDDVLAGTRMVLLVVTGVDAEAVSRSARAVPDVLTSLSRSARADVSAGRVRSSRTASWCFRRSRPISTFAHCASWCCHQSRWIAAFARCARWCCWMRWNFPFALCARWCCCPIGWTSLHNTSRVPWAPAFHPCRSFRRRSIRTPWHWCHWRRCQPRTRRRSWLRITSRPVPHVSLLWDPNPPPLTPSTRCRWWWLRWLRRCPTKFLCCSKIDCWRRTAVVPAHLAGPPRVAPSSATSSNSWSGTVTSMIRHAVAPMAAKDGKIVAQARVKDWRCQWKNNSVIYAIEVLDFLLLCSVFQ